MCWNKLIALFRKVDPEPLYPNELPNLSIDKVLEELEFDILIHEHWAVYVTQHPSYARTMGNYDWHIRWIEVYQNAIYYIRRSI